MKYKYNILTLRLVITAFLVSILLLFMTSTQVYSHNDYHFFREYIGQPINKTWTIQFNQKIDLESVMYSGLRVEDESGEIIFIEVNKSKDQYKLHISPDSTWEKGGRYTLYIRDIKSQSGNKLITPVKVPFSIIDEQQLRIELTWGATPRDLDANLVMPDDIVVNSMNPIHENAMLDMDIVSGYGAENILIKNFTDELYKYYVNSFMPLEESEARVRVYDIEGVIQEFNIQEDFSKNKWIVFYLYSGIVIPGH